MINTNVYLKYQAYGHVIKTLRQKLTDINDVQRPSVSTVIKLLGDSAAHCRQEANITVCSIDYELPRLLEYKLNYDVQKKYLDYISGATGEIIFALRELQRPTRGQIDKALSTVLNRAQAEMLVIQLGTSTDKQSV